jgi:hypothetical protein
VLGAGQHSNLCGERVLDLNTGVAAMSRGFDATSISLPLGVTSRESLLYRQTRICHPLSEFDCEANSGQRSHNAPPS